MVKKSINQALIDAGIITENQLREILNQASSTGKSLEQCLIENKITSAQHIAKVYAAYAGFEYIDSITDKMADLDLLAKVPLKFLRDNAVMPILVDGNIIILTANPVNFQALDDLNLLLGGLVKYAVAPYTVIIDGINRYYPLEGTKQMIEELRKRMKNRKALILRHIEEEDILGMAS